MSLTITKHDVLGLVDTGIASVTLQWSSSISVSFHGLKINAAHSSEQKSQQVFSYSVRSGRKLHFRVVANFFRGIMLRVCICYTKRLFIFNQHFNAVRLDFTRNV